MKVKELIFATGLGIATLTGCTPTPKVEAPITKPVITDKLKLYGLMTQKCFNAWAKGNAEEGDKAYDQLLEMEYQATPKLANKMDVVFWHILGTYHGLDYRMIIWYWDKYSNKKEKQQNEN